jgi:hypothetical protein
MVISILRTTDLLGKNFRAMKMKGYVLHGLLFALIFLPGVAMSVPAAATAHRESDITDDDFLIRDSDSATRFWFTDQPREFLSSPRSHSALDFSQLGQFSKDEHDSVHVPEPMVFDLVRPLGAKKGELEVNTLAVFPWRSVNRTTDRDPFGSGQTTLDRGEIEWAPEIEFAFADGWAIEFELPFEGSKLEVYKLALQGTFGTAFDNHYIHGFQVIVEPTVEWRRWNSTLLYLGGIRFDEQWSALVMFGGRMDLAGRDSSETFERLVNASLFKEVREDLVLGTEVNVAVGNRGRNQTLFTPQAHYDLNRHIQLQSGIGLGIFDAGSEQSLIMRLIYSR